MSIQILELLFFAGIAFLVITKLISVLGTNSQEDPIKRNSYFGEPRSLKDVTDSTLQNPTDKSYKEVKELKISELGELIVKENEANIVNALEELQARMPSFNPSNFLHSSKVVFQMIVDSDITNTPSLLTLVDPRYVEQFKSIAHTYGKVINSSAINVKISEIYMFGNNVFVKLLFTGTNVTSNIDILHEEWTFCKNLIASGPDWYLTNIDRL